MSPGRTVSRATLQDTWDMATLALVVDGCSRFLAREPTSRAPSDVCLRPAVNLRLVIAIAKRYSNRGLLLVDLIQTARLLHALPPREAEVLRLRFGIGGATEHTLEEVGGRFALTRERIRPIEAKALDRLRRRPGTKSWKSLIDT